MVCLKEFPRKKAGSGSGLGVYSEHTNSAGRRPGSRYEEEEKKDNLLLEELPAGPALMKACFAGGSYWLTEAAFGCMVGVVTSAVGFCLANDDSFDPNSEEGRIAAVQLTYDPQEVTYHTLLQTFWHCHDATDTSFQGHDEALESCRSAIFCYTASQRRTAHQSRVRHQMTLKKRIVTKLIPAGRFVYAGGYYQKFGLQSRQNSLFQSLEIKTLRQLIESTLACRLNGYVTGLARWNGVHSLQLQSFPSLSEETREQLSRLKGTRS